MKLFGSSGIRGPVNEKITPDLAMRVGRAVGEGYRDVILGHDPRPTSDMVKSSLIAGLTSVGADVVRTGMVSTPTLAYAAQDHDCGLMVTASHNPAPDNGIKMWNPDGSSFNTGQMEAVEDSVEEPQTLPTWDKVGKTSESGEIIDQHIEAILDIVGDDHDLTVALDCANGAGCSITPYLLRDMGCEVKTLNSNPDGTFPSHDPEPTEENLLELKQFVRGTEADLGIAHDGDADRMVAFDSSGRFLGGDTLLALFASEFSGSVAVPVNSSMVIDEIVDDVIRTKVGDVFVAQALKEHGTDFGGEPSGTWIFPEISYAPDGVYAAAFLVDLFGSTDIPKKIEQMPCYPRKKFSFEVSKKEEIMDRFRSSCRESFDKERLNFVDGVRISYEGGWALVRPSGTEPKIRITVEASDEQSLKDIFKNVKDRLERCMEE